LGVGLSIEEDGLVLVKTANSAHSMCVCSPIFQTGVNYWELRIDQFTSGINIGIAIPDKLSTITNYVGSDAYSWDYCNTGTKIHQGSSVSYGIAFQQGSAVGVLLDLDKHVLKYYVDGKDQGIAYELSKNESYCFAISLYANSKVTILPDTEVPERN